MIASVYILKLDDCTISFLGFVILTSNFSVFIVNIKHLRIFVSVWVWELSTFLCNWLLILLCVSLATDTACLWLLFLLRMLGFKLSVYPICWSLERMWLRTIYAIISSSQLIRQVHFSIHLFGSYIYSFGFANLTCFFFFIYLVFRFLLIY